MEITSYEKWIEDCINDGSKDFDLTLEKLRDYQLKKLRDIIEYTKENSHFYREKFKNINPYYIKNLFDFSKIVPFTLSEELSNKPLDFLCVPQHLVSRIVTLKTSGTTGNRKRIFFTERDLERTIDFFHNGMKNLVSKGDRVLILMPGDYYGSVGDLLKKGLKRLGCDSLVLGPVREGIKILEILKRETFDCIVGIPIQVYQLTRWKMAYEKYKGLKLKSVLLSADYVPNSIKKAIKEGFNCPVFTHYGMTEMGFGGGVECSYLSGYHMREADLYFEIIDPISGKVLPNGDYGEVVFTTLIREGMPLIRYRTGDYARFIKEDCRCSHVLPRMDYVRGRISETINIGDINLDIGTLDEIMFTIENLIDYKAYIVEGIILQIYTKSLNSRNTINFSEIKKALYSSKISQLFKKGRLLLEYCGEIQEIEISNGMDKRRFIKK
jgi:phenylacetate-CoA ligase